MDPLNWGLTPSQLAANPTLLSFDFITSNIGPEKTDTAGFLIASILGSTNLATDAKLNSSSYKHMLIKNRTTWGDVNGDDQVDILDLLIVADYITGRLVPAGSVMAQANVADWPAAQMDPNTSDPAINILDLIAMENIILSGKYPTGLPIYKITHTSVASLSKTDMVNATLSVHVLGNSIALQLKNFVPVRGLEIEFANVNAVTGKVISMFDRAQAMMTGNTLRVIVHGMNINELTPGDRVIAQFPIECNNPEEVTWKNLIVGAAGDQQLLNVDAELVYTPAKGQIPQHFGISQNFPNPFNPSTNLVVDVPKVSDVTVKIYNMLGQQVRTLFAGQMQPGSQTMTWDGKNEVGKTVASGTYIYRMTAGNFVQTKKMMFLK